MKPVDQPTQAGGRAIKIFTAAALVPETIACGGHSRSRQGQSEGHGAYGGIKFTIIGAPRRNWTAFLSGP